jgi:hypothetical protein
MIEIVRMIIIRIDKANESYYDLLAVKGLAMACREDRSRKNKKTREKNDCSNDSCASLGRIRLSCR